MTNFLVRINDSRAPAERAPAEQALFSDFRFPVPFFEAPTPEAQFGFFDPGWFF